MLNIEKYKDEILHTGQDITCCVNELIHNGICREDCRECQADAMKWLLSEASESILNDSEKKYLSAVIKPFRDKVKYIEKMSSDYYDEVYIVIGIKDDENIVSPVFKENKMYKRMKTEKEYTLEELGL